MAKAKTELQEDILRILLESPKTTGEVAMALGYNQVIEGKTYPKYNSVEPALKTLESYGLIHEIQSVKKTRGAKPTTYDIVYDRDTIKRILKEYATLRSDLPKNDNVISILIAEHRWITEIGSYPEIKKLDKLSKKKLDNDLMIQSQEAFWSSSLTDYFKGKYKIISISSFKNDLIEKLRTSSTFFKLFVDNSSDALKSRFYQIYSLSFHGEFLEQISEGDMRHPIIISNFLDLLYKTCVYQDILNGEKCDEAEQYIKELNEFKAKHRSLQSVDGSRDSYDLYTNLESGKTLLVQVKSCIASTSKEEVERL